MAGATITELQLGGLRFHFKKCGNWTNGCTPIFFLSGAFQSMASWRKFERYFVRRGLPVLLADLPGTGQADVLPSDYQIDFLSEATRLVIQASGARKVHLVSASYGTPIAYRCTDDFPPLIASLILAGTMKEIPAHVRPAILHNLETLKRNDMHEFARQGIEGGFLCRDPKRMIKRRELGERVLYQSMAAMTPHAKRQYLANTERLLTHPPLELTATHHVRSLVFTGEHDTFTTPAFCREVACSLHNSWYTTIAESDHLFHIQQFPITVELVQRFINDQPLGMEGMGDPEFVGKTANAQHSTCSNAISCDAPLVTA